MKWLRFGVDILYIARIFRSKFDTEVGIYKRKQENTLLTKKATKKERKHPLDQESGQEKKRKEKNDNGYKKESKHAFDQESKIQERTIKIKIKKEGNWKRKLETNF